MRNAKIMSTMLGFEDHGIFTCWLYLDYGGAGQGFGGYSFDTPINDENGKLIRIGGAYGAEFIRKILKTVGVDKWEQLPGKHIRVESSNTGVGRIGHIIEDQWFAPDDIKYLCD